MILDNPFLYVVKSDGFIAMPCQSLLCDLGQPDCSCMDFTNVYQGRTYGNCLNSGGRLCYVNEPTTCSDARDSQSTNKKYSYVACNSNLGNIINEFEMK